MSVISQLFGRLLHKYLAKPAVISLVFGQNFSRDLCLDYVIQALTRYADIYTPEI